MEKMQVVQVPEAGANFEIIEREIPQTGAGQVRIRVQACGICHSDVITKENLFPALRTRASGDGELVAMETKRLKDWVGGLSVEMWRNQFEEKTMNNLEERLHLEPGRRGESARRSQSGLRQTEHRSQLIM